MTPDHAAHYWQSAARTLARRINFGWWLDCWQRWVLALGMLGAITVLYGRWQALGSLHWVWPSLGLLILLAALVSWWSVRHRFESYETARIRLEDALGLKTRLSAASAGVGAWPEKREKLILPVTWSWQKPLGMVLSAGVLLALAVWIPISQASSSKKRLIEKPSAVKEVEQWVENLRQENATEKDSLDEVEKKIAELLQRPSENWYEHGSLEAAGHLKEQTAEMLRELSENLADAERAASALQAAGDALPQAAKDAIAKELASAAQGLKTGSMKPNEQLLQQLQQAGMQGLQNLSKEQMQQLAQMMQQNSQALQDALKNSPELKLALCQGCKPGEGQNGPGKGGINRGPGTAPLTFKQDETSLGTKKTESLASNLDLERLAPGDVMGVQDALHEVDKNLYQGPKQGGGIQNTGDGGAAVWQNSLLPDEREVLKRYFK